jgi:hypothetical protein
VANPNPQIKVALTVTYWNPAIALALIEDEQRSEAFFPFGGFWSG